MRSASVSHPKEASKLPDGIALGISELLPIMETKICFNNLTVILDGELDI